MPEPDVLTYEDIQVILTYDSHMYHVRKIILC